MRVNRCPGVRLQLETPRLGPGLLRVSEPFSSRLRGQRRAARRDPPPRTLHKQRRVRHSTVSVAEFAALVHSMASLSSETKAHWRILGAVGIPNRNLRRPAEPVLRGRLFAPAALRSAG